MSDLEAQRPVDPSKERLLPTVEQARADRDRFFELVKGIEESTTVHAIDPKARTLVAVAQEHANNIIQDAGKIPKDDPRHEMFECYNAILGKWGELIQLGKISLTEDNGA